MYVDGIFLLIWFWTLKIARIHTELSSTSIYHFMDYVRDGEVQGRSLVFLEAHCPCTGCLIVIWIFLNGPEGRKHWEFWWYISSCMIMRVTHLCFIIQFSKKYHWLASTASDRKVAKIQLDISWFYPKNYRFTTSK